MNSLVAASKKEFCLIQAIIAIFTINSKGNVFEKTFIEGVKPIVLSRKYPPRVMILDSESLNANTR